MEIEVDVGMVSGIVLPAMFLTKIWIVSSLSYCEFEDEVDESDETLLDLLGRMLRCVDMM